MKKVLAILVAVMLMATVCMTASAENACAMKIADVEIEEGATTVDVPVAITANDGIFGFIVEITYDTTLLAYNTVTPGELFTVTPNEKEPGVIKAVVESKDVTGNVTDTGIDAIVLSFNVVGGAAGDVAELTAALPDADSNIDANGDNVLTTVDAGSVSIIEKATEPTTEPTEAPTQPSEEPTQPTEAPTQPTEAPTTTPTAAPTTNAAVPSTGSVIPAAAVVLASASAAVLCFARKK